MGDVIDIYPYEGVVKKGDEVISEFELSPVLLDEVRAGGRIPLIIGRGLTGRAREALGLAETDLFAKPVDPENSGKGYTLHRRWLVKLVVLKVFVLVNTVNLK